MKKKLNKKNKPNLYRVTVSCSGYKVYYVEAMSEQEAMDNYTDGDCVKDESDMDSGDPDVECIERYNDEPEEEEDY